MTAQEKLVKAYDASDSIYGVKAKLKDLKGSSNVLYVISQCRKGLYTNNDVVEEYLQSLKDIAKDEKIEFLEMYNQIESI